MCQKVGAGGGNLNVAQTTLAAGGFAFAAVGGGTRANAVCAPAGGANVGGILQQIRQDLQQVGGAVRRLEGRLDRHQGPRGGCGTYGGAQQGGGRTCGTTGQGTGAGGIGTIGGGNGTTVGIGQIASQITQLLTQLTQMLQQLQGISGGNNGGCAGHGAAINSGFGTGGQMLANILGQMQQLINQLGKVGGLQGGATQGQAGGGANHGIGQIGNLLNQINTMIGQIAGGAGRAHAGGQVVIGSGRAHGGHDVIRGGAGNDRINGGAGNDRINGGAGNDIIRGGGGNDVINGGTGNDRINGGPGNDRINGDGLCEADRKALEHIKGVDGKGWLFSHGGYKHETTNGASVYTATTGAMAGYRAVHVGGGKYEVFNSFGVCIATYQNTTKSDKIASPIALDLNGDGKIGTTGATTAKDRAEGTGIGKTVAFDIDGNGTQDEIEWMDGKGDGLLVDTAKINGGRIDGKALFGDEGGKFANGYDKLALKDGNGDGQLTGAELSSLGIWQDDGNARVDAGEIKSLGLSGINQISTQKTDVANAAGETLMRSSANDGKVMTEDVWFAKA